MRSSRVFAVAIAVAVALLASSSIGADTGAVALSSSSSDKTADTYGVGGGETDIGTLHFDLSAHERPNLQDFGHWGVVVTNTLTGDLIARYRVDVFCVNVHNMNRGVARGVVTKVEPTPNALGVTLGETLIIGFKDGGNPGAIPVDDFFSPHTDIFPTINCRGLIYVGNFNNVTQGNVNVKEG